MEENVFVDPEDEFAELAAGRVEERHGDQEEALTLDYGQLSSADFEAVVEAAEWGDEPPYPVVPPEVADEAKAHGIDLAAMEAERAAVQEAVEDDPWAPQNLLTFFQAFHAEEDARRDERLEAVVADPLDDSTDWMAVSREEFEAAVAAAETGQLPGRVYSDVELRRRVQLAIVGPEEE